MDLLTLDALSALVTLTAMEIVLGIDNIIFIAILVARVPKKDQNWVRKTGIFMALFSRLALLASISWIMSLGAEWFKVAGHGFSGKDLILLGGGLFLIGKSTFEIHSKIADEEHLEDELKSGSKGGSGISSVLMQIVLLDVIFSLDSVITAVGMAKQLSIMVVAVVLAVGVMLLASGYISNFVEKNPTIKILALAFLILIGSMLVMEGMGQHVEKGYIYFAMAFSVIVELLNMKYRKKKPE